MNPQVFRWTGFVLAGIAAFLSVSLLGMHARGTSDLGLLAGICGEGGASCNKVISSRWGYLPPAEAPPESESEDVDSTEAVPAPEGSIPVAALGLFYFLFLAVYFAVVGQPTWPVRRLHAVMFGINGLGVLGTLFFMGIMFFVIEATCVLCLGTHICNFLLIGVMWKTRPEEPQFAEGAGLARPVLPHPDLRLGLSALLLAIGLSTAGWFQYRANFAEAQASQVAQLEKELAELEEELANPSGDAELRAEVEALRMELEQYELLQELAQDVERLDALHLSQDRIDLGVRPDDPKIARSRGKGMQLVVFSDVECPNCGKFDDFLKQELMPLFNGHLEVIYKHFPLSVHAHALPAAKALEAARLQGNELFWALHDRLRAERENLAAVDFASVAAEVGLDVARFLREMESPSVTQRIGKDIQSLQRVFRELGVDQSQRGIPAAFLNGRPVNRIIRTNVGWWKIKADVLRKARENSKQPW